MTRISGNVAVVTGAGSGIGRALAYDLAARGTALAISDVDVNGLAETATRCRELGARVHEQRLDVADRAAVLAYAAAVVAESMVALVLADAYRQKFAGDHIDDTLEAVRAYSQRIGWHSS